MNDSGGCRVAVRRRALASALPQFAWSAFALLALALLDLPTASSQVQGRAALATAPAAATRSLRELARGLRAQLRDMPAAVGHRHAGVVTVTFPAAWLFTLDTAQLRAEALPQLEPLAATLASATGTELIVVGHSDALGPRATNQAFTLLRAGAVADYLQQRGVAPLRMRTRGAGEAEPLEKKADSPAARQRNRRIEIQLRLAQPSRREVS